jgi:iron complex transport system substrate-binding protein
MRIVSLAPSNTEILFAIGAGDSIVGRTAYCDYPAQAKAIPKVGDWVSPGISSIRALRPDLVLTSTIVQEKLAAELKAAGLPVEHLSPRTLDDVFLSIRKIGALTGRGGESAQVAERLEQGLSDIEARCSGPRPRLYIEEWHEPPFVSGNWVPRIASMAGADYFPIAEGAASRPVEAPEMSGFAPQLIVLSLCGVKARPEIVLRRASWGSLEAVRKGKISVFDDSLLNRPGPRLLEGCRRLAALISSWRTAG